MSLEFRLKLFFITIKRLAEGHNYKILEIPSTSSFEEIKKSYRRLALKYHPDKNVDSPISEDKFKEIAEAYRVLSEAESKMAYDAKINNRSSKQPESNPNEDKQQITPVKILEALIDIRKRVVRLGRAKINETGLFENLQAMLNDSTISFLRRCDDAKTNKLIMNEVLICSKYISYDRAGKLIMKLVILAGSDNDAILKLHAFHKKQKYWHYVDKYKGVAVFLIIIIFFVVLANMDTTTSYSSSSDNRPSNGDLNSTFKSSEPEISPEQRFEKVKDSLVADGWQEQSNSNGQMPVCYNFLPKKGKIKNSLEVFVGSGTDVSIKVMNAETDRCIRYVFINSGTSYKIRNIPEGTYYLKIAYGKNWFSKIENGQCVGKFIRNPLYERGDDTMDFHIKHTAGGYSIPSYELKLDVIASDIANSFNSQNISEDDFNM